MELYSDKSITTEKNLSKEKCTCSTFKFQIFKSLFQLILANSRQLWLEILIMLTRTLNLLFVVKTKMASQQEITSYSTWPKGGLNCKGTAEIKCQCC